ncbi:MAG: hypothetical protein CML04_09565 [Pseudozobellia sp.]|nr:hypothetical protein [Pseudozobellia sp.]|tara:strand:- start:4192 stop:5442 length:1251 start_codon:yes stop_codon:yes gene_type:complete
MKEPKNLNMKTTIKQTAYYLILFLLTATIYSCSKDNGDDSPNIPEEQETVEELTPDPDPEPASQEDISQVDDAVTAFMQKYDVPGAALAVSVNEKMVYTKGYGLSNLENEAPTLSDDVFRVASLSKPFTSTAVMKLIDDGLLSRDDKVFGPDGILGDAFGTAILTENELKITIDHLLIHGGGGWAASSGGDPIDYEPQLDSNDFIEYLLNNWDLSHAPGDSYNYSNTGYWLLARIIEKVSGESYENYISNLIKPTGITSFKSTTFREDDREPNEVEYYGTSADSPYIYTIASRRDGDAGVVISAPDMLRFVCGIDGKTGRTDLISSASQNLMATPSEISHLGRGLGTWQEQNLLFFTGSLPGTRTWFYIDANGKNAVILLNYRRTDIAEFDDELNTLVYNLVKDNSIPWKNDLDQF